MTNTENDLSFLDDQDLSLQETIVVLTAYDYRKARDRLKINPNNTKALQEKQRCEEFFLSEDFEAYTSVDGSYILRKLEEEYR